MKQQLQVTGVLFGKSFQSAENRPYGSNHHTAGKNDPAEEGIAVTKAVPPEMFPVGKASQLQNEDFQQVFQPNIGPYAWGVNIDAHAFDRPVQTLCLVPARLQSAAYAP